MTPSMQRQRGEGKIGCIVILLILALTGAVAFKVVPIYWNNNELKESAKDIASRASVVTIPNIEAQVKAKARELDIKEASAPGAISVRKEGDYASGTCYVTFRYSQKIDFYGLTDYTLETHTVISSPYINANQ